MPYDCTFRYNVPLHKYTTFRTGGVAEAFAEPRNISELINIIKLCKNEQKEIYILGNGSNILVKDEGVKGIVIHLARGEFSRTERNGKTILAGGGVNLPQLIRKAAKWGLGGLEGMAGIPGTIGGAVKMNAGGKYGNISEKIRSVAAINYEGEEEKYNYNEIDFKYRSCNLNQHIIIKVEFLLEETTKEKILERTKEIYQEKLQKQPLLTYNAGCIFKNPHQYKAAELIEKAGLKGKKTGGAIVSAKHANFIINTGKATSADILELIKIIKETVRAKFNVLLETEILVW